MIIPIVQQGSVRLFMCALVATVLFAGPVILSPTPDGSGIASARDLGRLKDAYSKECQVRKANFLLQPIKKRVVCRVKIRYNHPEAEAEILPLGRNFKVRFKQAQFAITPGQSAVFYQRDSVIGGGIIR